MVKSTKGRGATICQTTKFEHLVREKQSVLAKPSGKSVKELRPELKIDNSLMA
jgi:hypothetical protein